VRADRGQRPAAARDRARARRRAGRSTPLPSLARRGGAVLQHARRPHRPGRAAGDEGEALAERLGYRDELLTTCEPYRLFAIEGDDALRARLGFADADPGVVVTDDVRPFRERKVRLLNGTHTISCRWRCSPAARRCARR
jgi:hypothetical protein